MSLTSPPNFPYPYTQDQCALALEIHGQDHIYATIEEIHTLFRAGRTHPHNPESLCTALRAMWDALKYKYGRTVGLQNLKDKVQEVLQMMDEGYSQPGGAGYIGPVEGSAFGAGYGNNGVYGGGIAGGYAGDYAGGYAAVYAGAYAGGAGYDPAFAVHEILAEVNNPPIGAYGSGYEAPQLGGQLDTSSIVEEILDETNNPPTGRYGTGYAGPNMGGGFGGTGGYGYGCPYGQ